MINNPLTKAKLIISIGFGTIMLVMAVLASTVFYNSESMVDNLDKSVVVAKKIQLSHNLFRSARERSINLFRMFVMDDIFDRDEERLVFKQNAEDFITARLELVGMDLTETEKNLLDKQASVTKRHRPHQEKTADNLIDDNMEDAKSELAGYTITGQTEALEPINEMNTIQNKQLQDLVISSREHHHAFTIQTISIFAVGTFLCLVTMLFVFRKVAQLGGELVDEKNKAEALSKTDSLTGICNRLGFEEQLKHVIHDKRHKKNTLLFMDLDQFKVINDTCGHIAGDTLLKHLTAEIETHMRDADIFARLGGDEFAVILSDCDIDCAYIVAEKLRKAVHNYNFVWENKIFKVGVSVGIMPIQSNEDISMMMSAADAAMYTAKDKGRNRIEVFDPSNIDVTSQQGEMQQIHKIHKALEDDSFEIYYQEIKPVGTGEVISADDMEQHADENDANFEIFYQEIQPMKDNAYNYRNYNEVLIRMVDEEGNLIPPMTFLPAAERYNLIAAIDKWVIRNIFKFLSTNPWLLRNLTFINLSGASINDEHFEEFFTQQLKEFNIPASSICLEITETVAVNNLQSAAKLITDLQEIGCKFALDDFGSGMSSFSYLRELPVNFLKIDGSFVKDICDNPINLTMVKSINEVGQVMGIQTIAEFVENEEIFDKLTEIGIDFAQGFGIAKPRSIKHLLPESTDKGELVASSTMSRMKNADRS